MQASQNMAAAASALSVVHPSLIVKEKLDRQVEVFLACEKTLITDVKGLEAPYILLAAFYAFNMVYPKGTTSFYTLLEILLLGMKPKKIPSIVSKILVSLK